MARAEGVWKDCKRSGKMVESITEGAALKCGRAAGRQGAAFGGRERGLNKEAYVE
ncbi:MAG: hypothetical protein ACOYI4_01400 [Christensenellales bacterium]|jgi:hypothetical protein